MLLWLVFALLSAGVLVALLRPLTRAVNTDSAAMNAGTAAVYRDQLAEIEAELRGGQITPEDAEAGRREIARRLLSAVPETASTGTAQTASLPVAAKPPSPSCHAAALALSIGLLLPAAAVVLYLFSGNPGLKGQPVASRQPPPAVSPDIVKLVTAVEARLKTNPEDGRGWDVIAPVYLRLARYTDAAEAYARAARLLGDNPARLSGLAEATMMASEGRVTDVARTALGKLLQLDPGNVQARFWLAFGKEQDGRLAEAAADYEQLLASAPPDAAWREALAERHEAVRTAMADAASPGVTPSSSPGRAASDSPASTPHPGPSQTDIAAAERLSATERQAMIDAMVSGLAARLEKDGSDLAGWQRLIRALNTLGRKDDAIAALGRARKSFEGQSQPLAELGELSRTLGLGS